MTHVNQIKHTTAENYEHFLSYMYGSGARHSALLCQAYFDGADAPHEEYEAYMAEHPEQAEPSQLADASLEPVATIVRKADYMKCEAELKIELPEGTLLYTTPPNTVARAYIKAAFMEDFKRAAHKYAPNDTQEQAEPIGYVIEDDSGYTGSMIYANKGGDRFLPVFLAPIRTKDLTDDEVWEILETHSSDIVKAVRSVIAADREKNRG